MRGPSPLGHQHLRAHHGFTLVELMVVLTILALLLLMAAPLATDWVSSARTHQSRATLVQFHAQAKALALRNPCAVAEDAVAMEIEASSQEGQVMLRARARDDAGDCAYASDYVVDADDPFKPLAVALLPAGVQLKLGGVAVVAGAPRTLRLNNRGLPTSDSASTAFVLGKGGQHNEEKGSLH